jgi:hypothetical protein
MEHGLMGYRSEVHLAVYTKNKGDFIAAFTRWRLDNGVDFTYWTMWDHTEMVDNDDVFGFLFWDEHTKWYGGYPDVEEVETTMKELPDYGFCVEFMRVGEEAGDVEDFEGHPDGVSLWGFFYPVTRVERDDLPNTYNHKLGDNSWIADYVENQSTIGDQRSDTQPASTAES